MYSRRARPGERPGTVGLGAVRGTIPDPGAIPIARHPPVARTHCRSDSNRPCVQLSTDYTLMHDAGCSATGLSSPHALTPHTTQARNASTQTVWGPTTRERHVHTPWHSGPPRHEKNSTYLGRPTSHTNSTRIRMRRVRSPPKLPSSHRSFMIGGSSQSPHGAEPLRSQPASPKGSTPQRGVARECMLIACLISEA